MADMVNHPDHYKANGLEVIDIIEKFGLGFHLGNAVKYILRAGVKTEDPVDDLEKAIWYLNRVLDNVEYKITDKGKAVADLLNAGFKPPIVNRLGFKSVRFTFELKDDGKWHSTEAGISISTEEIIEKAKLIGANFVDLDAPVNDEPQPRQLSDRLFHSQYGDEVVDCDGDTWKFVGDGWRVTTPELSYDESDTFTSIPDDYKPFRLPDKEGYGGVVDLDEPEKEEESNLRQQAIEEIRQAGHFVPEGERLFYVNPSGSAWKLNDNGKWVGSVISLSTEDVKRYLVCDGADVRGTIRTSDHGFRVLREVLNFPDVGDRIEDVDGDVWEFNGLSWIFDDLKKSTEQVRQYHGPISLPDEEV